VESTNLVVVSFEMVCLSKGKQPRTCEWHEMLLYSKYYEVLQFK
jgi:hypothetical protein